MIMSFKIVGNTTVHQEEIKLSVERRVIKKKKAMAMQQQQRKITRADTLMDMAQHACICEVRESIDCFSITDTHVYIATTKCYSRK